MALSPNSEESTLKFVFVDVDGVLVTEQTLEARRTLGLRGEMIANPACVAALNHIIRSTGARLVLSSAWRFCGLEEMKLILGAWGIQGEVVDMIPDLTVTSNGRYHPVSRGEEIQRFIEDVHLDPSREMIERYVVLDDDWKCFESHPVGARLIATCSTEGLTLDQAASAVNLLTGR